MNQLPNGLLLVFQIVGTVGGIFLGAGLAYEYARRRERENRIQSQVDKCNEALFRLSHQLAFLVDFEATHAEECRGAHFPHIMMAEAPPAEYERYAIKASDLAFLLDGDTTSIPGKIALQDQRFRSLLQNINERSQLHREVLYPVFEALEYPPNWADANAMLSIRHRQTLDGLTNSILRMVAEQLLGHHRVLDEAREALQARFPNHKFVRLLPVDDLRRR